MAERKLRSDSLNSLMNLFLELPKRYDMNTWKSAKKKFLSIIRIKQSVLLWIIFQWLSHGKFIGRVSAKADSAAYRVLPWQVELEERDAPEDETLDARDEVDILVINIFWIYKHIYFFS